ncbi:MAG: DUF1294 domain-containing protein [Phycisphaerales bacterium]|nr:DUF1294 domain-containing protein [Phycisphaerales bacterium]
MARRSPESITAYVLGALSALLPIALMRLFGLGWLPAWLIGVNFVTFGAYAFDKAAARRGARRVPERILQVLALIGGSPAALLAQRVYRHKTSKFMFQLTFWMILALQIVLFTLYCLLT